jgi:type IX secretion system PorP/SprF family membrane protein
MRKLLLFIAFFCAAELSAQHSAIYSQYFFSGVLINPAYAGSQGALNLTALYRNQWTGMQGAPENVSIGIHSPLKNEKLSLGLLFFNDSYGLTSENRLYAIYAYRLPLANGHISFGLQGGVNAQKQNWSGIETVQAEDPVFTGGVERKVFADFGAGAYFNNERLFAGISSPVLYRTEKNYSLSSSPVLLSAGAVFTLSEQLKLKPSLLFKYLKNSPAETDLTATFILREMLGIGFGYRSQDAVYGYFDLRVNEQLHFGYCYDYTISRLSNYSNGSHEIMLRYMFEYKLHSKSPRYF